MIIYAIVLVSIALSSDHLQDLISGFIWRLLCSRVFNASTVELCRDPAWKAYSLLVEDLRGEPGAFSCYRCIPLLMANK